MLKTSKYPRGFTLIELLVVVLIIGILAAIALPQYKKAIWRSRTKGMLPILRNMKTSADVYYLVNGVYPSKLDELDITLEGFTETCSSMGPSFLAGGCKANNSVNLFLNVASKGWDCYAMFQFNKGPYRGAGFFMHQDNNMVYCYEHAYYIAETKSFCENVMGCEYISSVSTEYDLFYICPDL